MTTGQVAVLNNEIETITVADLKQKFNPEKMKALDVYPAIWDQGPDAFDCVADGFFTLQKVFATATQNGEAIITFLS